MSDPSTWFNPLGACICGRPATGQLMNNRNDSMGPYCRKCAEARIKSAEKERARLKALTQEGCTRPT